MEDQFIQLDEHYISFSEINIPPNLIYGVIKNGKIIHYKSITRPIAAADIAETHSNNPVNPQSQFRIASMTKSFTACAILLLRDLGKLQLDSPVSSFVPEFNVVTSPVITVRHLLSHAAGLTTDDPWGDRLLDISKEKFLSLINDNVSLCVPPGREYHYSNLGFSLLGYIIEVVSKERAQDFITRCLLTPLGLTRTTWTPLPNAVIGYRYENDVKKYFVETPLSDGYFAPMGGLWSTIEDLSVWVTFLLDAFSEDGTPPLTPEPLSRASRREMQRVCNAFEPSGGIAVGYGMGLRISYTNTSGWMISHSGGLPGFGSNMIWSLKHRVGIASLGNITYCPLHNGNIRGMDILLSILPDPPPPKVVPSYIQDIVHRFINVFSTWANGKEVDKLVLDNLFSLNIFLDVDLERRMREAIGFNGFLPFEISSIIVKNNATADIELKELIISILLAPVRPFKIQEYKIKKIEK